MALINLGNAVGLLRGEIPPAKTYVIWGKIINPALPDIVELRYYKGSGDPALEANWLPISLALQKVVIFIPKDTPTININASQWSSVGAVPIMQLLNTSDGSIEYATPQYNGITTDDVTTWTPPTSADLYFGATGAPYAQLLLIG